MTRTPRAALAAALFLALAATPLVAGDLPLAFDVSPRIWGADLGIGYTGLELLDGRETTLWLWAGGGWETMPYYRIDDDTLVGEYLDLGTGTIAHAHRAIDAENDPFYQRAEGKWQLGIVQGLVAAEGDQPDPRRGVPVLPWPLRRAPRPGRC